MLHICTALFYLLLLLYTLPAEVESTERIVWSFFPYLQPLLLVFALFPSVRSNCQSFLFPSSSKWWHWEHGQMASCCRHHNKSPQKHSHWKHRYYTHPAYHQRQHVSKSWEEASSIFSTVLNSQLDWMGWWGGKADLFKLHINISRTSPPHFLSVLGGNIQWAVSNFSWCFWRQS